MYLMEEWLAYVRNRLHLEDAQVQVEPVLARGIRADAVLTQGDAAWILEVKRGQVGQDSLAQLSLYRDLWQQQHDGEVHPVLVAPAISRQLQEVAEAADIQVLQVPFEMLPRERDGGAPLTTERSWRVVSYLLVHGQAGSIEELARTCGASTGWVHRVVRSLEGHGFIERGRGRIGVRNLEGILDLAGLERPLRSLETVRLETGYDDWDSLVRFLQAQLTDLAHPPRRWGLAGTSAASRWTGYELRHNRVDVYADPADLRPLFPDARGGIPLVVYRMDRDVEFEAVQGIQTVSLRQALLDTLGLGYGQRDLALAVLERMKA